MPILATMGIKALYYHKWLDTETERNAVPEQGMIPVDVYQETCSFVDRDADTTTHKSETSSKKITIYDKDGADLAFSIMDPSKQERADFEGGTYDQAEKSYTTPETVEQIQMAFVVVPDAGDTLLIPCADVSGKKNTTYSKKGITLLEVTATPSMAVKYVEEYTVNAKMP